LAVLLATPALSASAVLGQQQQPMARPNQQMVRPYQTPQMAPRRMAQMPSAAPDASVIYDGPTPAPQVYGPSGAGAYQHQHGNFNGGYSDGGYGGGCNCGANGGGNCGSGCGGACGGNCGGNCGGYGGDCYGDYCGGGCGDDCGGYCGDSCDFGPANCQPCLRMYVDWLFLEASGADVAHAQQQDGLGGAGTVPFGDIGTVETECDSGVRAGFLIACGPCSGFETTYTSYETDAFNSLEAPFIPGGGGAVGSLVHHPNASITASVGPVDATYEIDYQMFDMMYRSTFACSPCYTASYLLGVQYGNLDQVFTQTGIFGGGSAGTIDTTSTIDFDGGGLKAGIDTERQLHCGFSLYGRLTGAMMSGRFSSRYTMFNSSTDVLLAQANWKDDRIVPHVEYELGLGWTSPSDKWRFATGYMYSHWLNTVSTSEFIDAVQADNYVDVEDTLTFDGFVTRMECRW
jgi:major outer membrane protein